MGIIDQKAKSGEIKPKLWWKYQDYIFDLWTWGTTKLNEFTDFVNSLYPTIKLTMVSSEISLTIAPSYLLTVPTHLIVPKLSHLVLLPGFAEIVPQSKNLKNVVKSIRSILLIGVTALLKLNNNLKRPKIHPGRTSLPLNCEREKLFPRGGQF